MFISLDQEKTTEFGQNSITPSEGDVKINTLSDRSVLRFFLMLHRVGTFKDSVCSVDLHFSSVQLLSRVRLFATP